MNHGNMDHKNMSHMSHKGHEPMEHDMSTMSHADHEKAMTDPSMAKAMEKDMKDRFFLVTDIYNSNHFIFSNFYRYI